MTSNDLTRSLIYLDLNDMDGLIDIARYGVVPMTTNPKTQQLIQQLANGIVSQVLGDKTMTAVVGDAPADPDNGEERPLFEGRAALAVLPLAPLQQQVSPPVD
jgi:hypothetical protein